MSDWCQTPRKKRQTPLKKRQTQNVRHTRPPIVSDTSDACQTL
jgi:hypothetical protein